MQGFSSYLPASITIGGNTRFEIFLGLIVPFLAKGIAGRYPQHPAFADNTCDPVMSPLALITASATFGH
jgi:hypothetical protein